MSKKAEEMALKAYPIHSVLIQPARRGGYYADNHLREGFIEGYKQGEKGTIARIREQVKQWMPEKDGEEYTCGKRLAFNSVLYLLEEMEEKQ